MVGQNKNDTVVFWGCFIALITTAFGFITRMFLISVWEKEFGLDSAEVGRLAGMGIWPFAVSIIVFSLFIDKIGYKTAMFFAFVGHIVWAICGYAAYVISDGGKGDPETAFRLLYWGSLVMALGNGTVEAFINPVVATMFSTQKTKWLNILHAGWPGGLVIAGIIVIFMGDLPWGYKVVTIAAPAVVYLLLLSPRQFPVSERASSGVSYRSMLAEFGILGALIVGFLVTLQLMNFFSNNNTIELSTMQKTIFIGIGVAIVVGFGLYTRAVGRPLMFVLVLIMMPLATTEIGTDGWITGIMEGVFKMSPADVEKAGGIDKVLVIDGTPYTLHSGWVLVYTSAIMMVLRFFAGPIVHKLSPLGLLAISAVLAILGLYTLSFTAGMMIFFAATLYGIGKTFFWPTMLGVVSEQTPKGGALTLNAISGIGMLAVGTLGFPFIGKLQADKQIEAIAASRQISTLVPGAISDGELKTVTDKQVYEIINYKVVDDGAFNRLMYQVSLGDELLKTIAVVDKPAAIQKQIDAEQDAAKRKEWETQFKVASDDRKAFDDLMAGNVEALQTKLKEATDADTRDSLTKEIATAEEQRDALLAKTPAGLTAEKITQTQELVAQVGELRTDASNRSKQGALATMTVFPLVMLIAYLGLIFYFKSRGGYKAEVLTGHKAEDGKFTGGVEGAVE